MVFLNGVNYDVKMRLDGCFELNFYVCQWDKPKCLHNKHGSHRSKECLDTDPIFRYCIISQSTDWLKLCSPPNICIILRSCFAVPQIAGGFLLPVWKLYLELFITLYYYYNLC